MAVGFDEKSADVRIAQYENNSRKPKEELMRKIAAALDVSVAYLEDPTMNDAEGILPVSYTHLDVYKRQPQYIFRVFLNNPVANDSILKTAVREIVFPNGGLSYLFCAARCFR